MGQHLVLAGGGHAHMVTLANLHEFIRRGHRVTVIAPSGHHYYSGMGPGMLGFNYQPAEIRFATQYLVEKNGGTFLRAKVIRIDPDKQKIFCSNGASLDYDVLSFNTGSFVPDAMARGQDRGLYTVKPIERLMDARRRLIRHAADKHITVGVVGGGAAAVEIAGNVRHLLSRSHRHGFKVFMCTKGRLLNRFPVKVQAAARQALLSRHIDILEDAPVDRIRSQTMKLASGQSIRADFIFLATGVRPSPIFKASGLAMGPDGGLLVNRFLQSCTHANIFGGGDCIYYQDQPLDKVGVYAVRQNPVLYRNLLASVTAKPLTAFDPGGAYLLIFNLGHRHGVLYRNGLFLSGRLAFQIKDFIDRRFMRRFQQMERRQ